MRNSPRVTPTILRHCFLVTYQHLASGSRPRYLVNLQLPALDYSICETNIGFVDLRRCITRNTRLWRASGIPYSPPLWWHILVDISLWHLDDPVDLVRSPRVDPMLELRPPYNYKPVTGSRMLLHLTSSTRWRNSRAPPRRKSPLLPKKLSIPGEF